MALAISEDHRELATVAKKFAEAAKAKQLTRSILDASPAPVDEFWTGMVEQGWPGLHIPESHGGEGYGLTELSIVLAELAAAAAPEILAPTAAVAALLSASGSQSQRERWLTGLAGGSIKAGVSTTGAVTSTASGDSVAVAGVAGAVVGGVHADLFAVISGDDVVLVDAGGSGVSTEPVAAAMDPSLGLLDVTLTDVAVDAAAVVTGGAARLRSILRTVFAAEAVGIADVTLTSSVEYAKIREQFGRPVGSFQAVKHHCANMAIKREVGTAATWDACRTPVDDERFPFLADAAAAAAFTSAQFNAQKNIQIHGGIGFTWDHDAHLYLRRAVSLAQLIGPVPALFDATYDRVAAGARGRYAIDLPDTAQAHRAEVREFVEKYKAIDDTAKALEFVVDSGYAAPHWPPPYGRDAGAVEQLVIAEELRGVKTTMLGIGGWILLTLVQNADPDQVARWIRPTLLGEHTWCQLFSEPGAGSDASAIATKGVRVEGGWRVTGQKVWTSGAEKCDLGLATVRTDPTAAKRDGITAMVLDMTKPEVTVRPLREITGLSLFNEVFIDDLFVPDADVIGEPGSGWSVARATLGNERVSIGGGLYKGVTAIDLVDAYQGSADSDDVATRRSLGELLVEEHAMALIGVRNAGRAVFDEVDKTTSTSPDGNISKILTAEHSQRIGELGVELLGPDTVVGKSPRIGFEYMFARSLTLGGGTSEISRNVIAERMLGLPREPNLA